ncbi:hypothetical protein ADN00_11565 [Ornatilinea apprima]|uniref:Uncharacterized protein n=1 Tax=Ornatilinea apprima TaxID=1134406 RepID=A0A0P6XLI7_9CHLR|nr:hypothetical protein [Ornatilinea apprima]KPL75996.1 hypothetical protein ADN00_11565 [Ornatilinea apprima]
MFTPVMFIQFGGAVVLILLGAWVIIQGVNLITEFYPRTLELTPQVMRRGAAAQPVPPRATFLASLDELISAEIRAINLAPQTRLQSEAAADEEHPAALSGAGDPPEDADILPVEPAPPAGEQPAAPPADSSAQHGKPPAPTDRIEAIARIVEALPSILNANFGPAAVLCLVGLALCAGGFVLILNLGA